MDKTLIKPQIINTQGVKRITVFGVPGKTGPKPTDAELKNLIEPLIPSPVPGTPGSPGKTPTAEELLALIRPLIPKIKDGETPSDERLLALIRPLIPAPIPGTPGTPGKPGKRGSADTGDEIILKVNKSKLKIDWKRIKDIETLFTPAGNSVAVTDDDTRFIEAVRELKFSTGLTVSVDRFGTATVTATSVGSFQGLFEVPTGTKDGVNLSFSVLNSPKYIVIDGLQYFESVSYTYAALTITITDQNLAPRSDSVFKSAY